MQRTAIDKSLKGFNFEILYLTNPEDIQHINDPNYEDILYVKCYPKWNMNEQELKKYIEPHKRFLLSRMEEISENFELFYCYFDIDFSNIKGTTSNLIDNKIVWIEKRPEIKPKNINNHTNGFIDAGELPPEN